MSQRRALLARNGAANLIRAVASSAVGVILPLVLLAVLSDVSYAAWALIFSIAGYVMFFDVGMPASVQTLVARSNEEHRPGRVREATVSGLKITLLVIALFTVASAILAWALPTLSPDMNSALVAPAGIALVIVGVGQSANLLSNAAAAYFAGLQRNVVPTLIVAPARILSLVFAGTVALLTQDLVITAVAYTIPCVAAAAMLTTRALWETRSAPREADRQHTVRRLIRFSGPIVLWTAALLPTTSLGIVIVARFAYQDLVAYSIGQVVYTAMYGLIAAVGAPLLPELSRSHVSDSMSIGDKILRATRAHSALLFSIAICAVAATPLYLFIAAGADRFADLETWGITLALICAATVHLAASPLSMGFIATAQHGKLILSPILEAATTIATSLLLVQWWGGLGVALGAVLGSIVGVAVTCHQAIPRVSIPGLRGVDAGRWALYVPLVGLILALALVAGSLVTSSAPVGIGLVWTLAAIAVGVSWQAAIVMPRAEWSRVLQMIRARRGSSR